jgi:hypothetical protein
VTHGFSSTPARVSSSDFKPRNRFSSRRPHLKPLSLVDLKAVGHFKHDIKILLRDTNQDIILNCDETAWRPFPGGILTGAPIGTNSFQVQINGDENAAITGLATITASGKKLPVLLWERDK